MPHLLARPAHAPGFTSALESPQQVIVLANREPYTHVREQDGRLSVRRGASGVVNAVEPLLQASKGVWVAHGSGSADREAVTERDGIAVPPEHPAYRLRRVWLQERDERGFYDGFANSALWPLCHRAYVRPVFRDDHYRAYRTVNRLFVDTVCEEARDTQPFVFVQDYHFALAPAMIRAKLPRSAIATFWHIPWPQTQTFALCPWKRELLEGLLGSDVIGFQTPDDCLNFLDTVEVNLDARIDRGDGMVFYGGARTLVRDYAASIDWPGPWALGPSVAACRAAVIKDLRLPERVIIGVGVDRFDYTKGIEEKFLAIERLLELRPDLRGRFVFVQLAQPSRHRLPAYRTSRLRVLETAARINRRFSSGESSPIVVLEDHHSSESIARHFRAADLCIVGSLHDGMNLVAKEFVASRDDCRGVLLLSAFAGAARELGDAIVINPYDIDGAATAVAEAIAMSPADQAIRMAGLRRVVAEHHARAWSSRIMDDAMRMGTASVVQEAVAV
jgi:trehalose 6-phosphate synthase